jgi:hypothetical protein
MMHTSPLRAVSLIGVPTDIGAGTRGASMGPEALRVAGIAQAIAQFGLEVQDVGNLQGPANPWLPAANGFRHLHEVVAWNQLTHAAVYAQLQAQRLPVMPGTARRKAKNCACCGLMPMPTSIPPPSRPAAISTACRWPACAAKARRL